MRSEKRRDAGGVVLRMKDFLGPFVISNPQNNGIYYGKLEKETFESLGRVEYHMSFNFGNLIEYNGFLTEA
jgi:hypothetical protein